MQTEAARIREDLVEPILLDVLPSEHQQLIPGDNQAKHLQRPQHCTPQHTKIDPISKGNEEPPDMGFVRWEDSVYISLVVAPKLHRTKMINVAKISSG